MTSLNLSEVTPKETDQLARSLKKYKRRINREMLSAAAPVGVAGDRSFRDTMVVPSTLIPFFL